MLPRILMFNPRQEKYMCFQYGRNGCKGSVAGEMISTVNHFRHEKEFYTKALVAGMRKYWKFVIRVFGLQSGNFFSSYHIYMYATISWGNIKDWLLSVTFTINICDNKEHRDCFDISAFQLATRLKGSWEFFHRPCSLSTWFSSSWNC